jgi:hypothetical protein
MLNYVSKIQNVKVISQHRNDMRHVQSLENDFYPGALGSFYYVFTQLTILGIQGDDVINCI